MISYIKLNMKSGTYLNLKQTKRKKKKRNLEKLWKAFEEPNEKSNLELLYSKQEQRQRDRHTTTQRDTQKEDLDTERKINVKQKLLVYYVNV